MKINAKEIPIYKRNNVLYIVTQKVHENEWNVYNVFAQSAGAVEYTDCFSAEE